MSSRIAQRIRPEWRVGGDQVRQVLAAADLVDLAGVVRRPVRVRAQVDQETSVHEPAHHERRHVRLLTDHVGVPSAAAIRSAAASPEMGGVGIAARMASASIASTAARAHRDDGTSGQG
ncbi:hypothetical protein ACH4JS_13020 [Streptomyces sp. NPDC017638]|uniref:hypothetical protein n=1 Tax=Streptomyces sp. NPDC017638 TaxID=3365004 RepID=UPI0037AF1B21